VINSGQACAPTLLLEFSFVILQEHSYFVFFRKLIRQRQICRPVDENKILHLVQDTDSRFIVCEAFVVEKCSDTP
jgi:hypothetical protein